MFGINMKKTCHNACDFPEYLYIIKLNKMKNKITPPPVPPKDINEWFEYISAMATKLIIAGFLIEIVYHTTKSI